MKKPEIIPSCDSCQRNNPLFKYLQADELVGLGLEKGCNFYKRGDIIYHEGIRLGGIYCINKGVVKIFKSGIDGREQIIRFAKEGDIIGFRSVLINEPACTTSKVIEDAIICFIPANKFLELVKQNSDFSMGLMRLSCKELGESNKYILDIAQKNVRERLAEVLLLLLEKFGTDEDGVLDIILTREELASIVGTATESVIRLLSEFKHDNIIEIVGRKIRILNPKKLSKICDVY